MWLASLGSEKRLNIPPQPSAISTTEPLCSWVRVTILACRARSPMSAYRGLNPWRSRVLSNVSALAVSKTMRASMSSVWRGSASSETATPPIIVGSSHQPKTIFGAKGCDQPIIRPSRKRGHMILDDKGALHIKAAAGDMAIWVHNGTRKRSRDAAREPYATQAHRLNERSPGCQDVSHACWSGYAQRGWCDCRQSNHAFARRRDGGA